jgi:hypothetical protein
MTSIVISNQSIDPNCLRDATKLPLPDFAIAALKKNGLDYHATSAYTRKFEHDLQQQTQQCKLNQHIHSIKSHIDKDGPRLWASSSVADVGNDVNSQHSEGSKAAN